MLKKTLVYFLIITIIFSSVISPALASELPENESMEINSENTINANENQNVNNLENNRQSNTDITENENIEIKNTKNKKTEEDYIKEEYEEENIVNNNISVNNNIEATIIENSEKVLEDLGIEDGFIADIELISRPFFLRNNSTVVTLKAPQYTDGANLAVIHFIEDINYISEDTIILNISNYSKKTKNVLEPAINAYQEYSNTTDEFVAIEIFEDILIEEDTITFETQSFSIFAVGTIFLNTFEFYLDDELINTQYIIGDSSGKGLLLQPDIPVKENYQFKGWKINNTDKYQSFGTIPVNMNEHTTVKLYADYEEVCYAYFLYEAAEGAYVLETLTGNPGDTVSTLNVDYPLNIDKHIMSWHTDVTLTSPPIETITFVSGETIILYPNVAEGAWVTFYTDGGSYMDSVFYPTGEPIVTPSNPTKTGYAFSHWVDEENNTFVFENQTLSSSISLTAIWTPANTNYYVQIMFERQNENGKYDAATGGLFVKQGATGSTVNGNMTTETERTNAINNIDDESAFITDFAYYEYNATKSAESTDVVLGDGTSIVYVYYDLKYYTVTFDLGTTTGKKLTIGGKSYVSGSNVEQYKITAKYGDLIADKWPLTEHFEGDDNFRRWQYKKGYYWATKQHYMIGSDLIGKTLTADYSTGNSIIAWYLVESLDQTSSEGGSFEGKDFRKLYEGVYYDMDPVYTQEVKSTVSQWSTQKPIAGYNIVKMVKDSGNNCVYMYYSRTRHNLKIYNQDELLFSADNIMYGTPLSTISGLSNYVNGETPICPPDYPKGTYQFDGWYNTIECYDGTDVNLKTLTIPNQDLILYAKWTPIDVKLYVHITIDGIDEIIEGFNGFTVLYGEKVDKDKVDELIDSVNVPEEAIWYGWYEKINVGENSTVLVPYNFNRELITDLVLYPFYSFVEPTNIKYELNGGSGSAPIDKYSYAVGKGAVILNGEDVIPPDNKLFLGWNTRSDGTGKTYYPNDVMVLTEQNSTLYALYGDIPTENNMTATLTYYNTISGEEVSEKHKIYDTITIKNCSVFTESISKKYVFKEFNTSADGSGTSFSVGDEINITLEGENVLYAIYNTIDVLALEIPITKYFNSFSSTDEIFAINGFFCDENGIATEENIENISFKYKGTETFSTNLEISLDIDALVENQTYYIKVYETLKENPELCDTNYYIVSFTINGLTPTILDAKKYMEDGTEISSFVYENSLDFVTKVVIFSVTVPIALPIDVDSDGVVTTIPVVIINNSTDTVVVKNMAISSVDDWEIVGWDSTDMVAEKVGAKKIAMLINGDKTTDDGLITFTASNFPQIDSSNNNNNELLITYDAKLPAQLTSISNLTIANVVFTVGFNTEEIINV